MLKTLFAAISRKRIITAWQTIHTASCFRVVSCDVGVRIGRWQQVLNVMLAWPSISNCIDTWDLGKLLVLLSCWSASTREWLEDLEGTLRGRAHRWILLLFVLLFASLGLNMLSKKRSFASCQIFCCAEWLWIHQGYMALNVSPNNCAVVLESATALGAALGRRTWCVGLSHQLFMGPGDVGHIRWLTFPLTLRSLFYFLVLHLKEWRVLGVYLNHLSRFFFLIHLF